MPLLQMGPEWAAALQAGSMSLDVSAGLGFVDVDAATAGLFFSWDLHSSQPVNMGAYRAVESLRGLDGSISAGLSWTVGNALQTAEDYEKARVHAVMGARGPVTATYGTVEGGYGNEGPVLRDGEIHRATGSTLYRAGFSAGIPIGGTISSPELTNSDTAAVDLMELLKGTGD
ncbi:MAG: hypothetical protein H7A21_18995 [Spirochaetales bacterium]|nr:hypothetical protein [Leptospiraceae bacterium]MCP5483532.1 hypothetical protein [Spirochaetales bacterium]MCP5486897.1 hypothetical protein [Spirochaetales bacterium]